MLARLRRFGVDGFLMALMAMTTLAWVWPALGRSGGLVRLDLFTSYGVALVFLLYGLTLSPERLKAGLLNWRLHVMVQISTFLVFPVLVWSLGLLAAAHVDSEFRLGFFFLAALPSTISSSVAMTSIAHGNVAGAIFNASLSSLIGVLITPLWVNCYLSTSGQPFDLWHVLLRIMMLVLAPIIAGQILRPFVHRWIARHGAGVKFLDRATILAIVLNSFSDSIVEGVWDNRGGALLAQISLTSVALFVTIGLLTWGACRTLGFNREDTIAGIFCGTKKSLAAGAPMAKIMFGASPLLGVVIAPLVIYHFIQLVIASVLARSFQHSAPKKT